MPLETIGESRSGAGAVEVYLSLHCPLAKQITPVMRTCD